MVNLEIDSVVSQFKLLLATGHEASLKLDSKLGEVWISLNCKVGRNEPPACMSSPTNYDVKSKYRSPSYFRRQARRRSERESRLENDSLANVSTPLPSTMEESFVHEAVEAEKSTNLNRAEEAVVTQIGDKKTVAENEIDEPSCDNLSYRHDVKMKDVVNECFRQESANDERETTDVATTPRVDDRMKEKASDPHCISNLGHYPLPRLELLKF